MAARKKAGEFLSSIYKVSVPTAYQLYVLSIETKEICP